MSGLKIFLVVLLAIDSIALTVIVLMQEGQAQGLGTISGMADSYWGQNKGRSLEGKLVMITRILGALFLIISAKILLLFTEQKAVYLMPLLAVAVYASPAFEQGGSAEELCLPLIDEHQILSMVHMGQLRSRTNFKRCPTDDQHIRITDKCDCFLVCRLR